MVWTAPISIDTFVFVCTVYSCAWIIWMTEYACERFNMTDLNIKCVEKQKNYQVKRCLALTAHIWDISFT